MEEILVERTIVALTHGLPKALQNVWRYNEDQLGELNSDHQKNYLPPFLPVADDFFRFSLDERVSSKNYRFVVSSQRTVIDSTHRGDVANEYDVEIMFLYDYRFDGKSRYYIPMRVREAIIKAIEENFRFITRRSSDITLTDITTAEATGKGSRTVVAGLLYKIIA